MTKHDNVPQMQNVFGGFRANGHDHVRTMAFYGTLRHVPLLETVLNRPCAPGTLIEATMPDHAVCKVTEGHWPMIQRQPGATAVVLLMKDASAADIARLSDFETGWGYTLEQVEVRMPDGTGVIAQMFLPGRDNAGMAPDGPWSLADWVREEGDQALAEAREYALMHGHLSPKEMAARDPIVGIRATARLAAEARPADPDRPLDTHVEQVWLKRSYVNFFALDEVSLRIRRYDGTMGAAIDRAAFWVGDAVVVLPYDPVADTVLLVEQFRVPVYVLGDPNPWVWEPVAGLIDAGETPVEAAHREAAEEAGLTLKALEPVAGAYSSTGSSTEFLHLFIGITDLSSVDGHGGLASEGEDIRSRVIPFDQLMAEFDAGAFKDLPLVTSLLWLARHRDRLRDSA
ncbi:NUDIX domain-containing protein [Chachezhania sediminis]|uniref:NUDIX domain-containing protein n=1 Tax=Chachezhania sediminis TaxID=2599291 RepID=UPI001E36D72C|nr:NUDIX domain-containing protein [Chachezhania sediminis]